MIPFWLDPYSDAVGVGSEQEDTISEVRGADGTRGNTVPLRSPPARAQVPEDFLESSAAVNGKEPGDVLDKEPSRPDLLDDAPDLRPEPPLVFCAEALTRNAGTLTGETCNDEIHSIAIVFAREGFQSVVDRTRIHGTFFHSMSDDRSGVGLPLNNTHKSNSGASNAGPKLEAEVSAAECKARSRSGT